MLEGLIAGGIGIGLIAVICLPPVLIGITLAIFLRRRNKSADDERLEQLQRQLDSEWTPGPQDQQNDSGGSGGISREEVYAKLDNVLASRGIAGNIRGQLRKANVPLSVTEYLIMHVVVAVGLTGILWVFFPGPRAAIGFIVGLFLPRIYVTIRQRRRLKAFNNQLVDILGLWVNALRAGFSVPQALEAVAREAPSPASDEFKRVVAEMSIGVPFDTTLSNMQSRIGSEDLDLVFTAVNIQREVGGNLAEILEVISFTIRERIRIKGEIQVLTSSGRATGFLIGLLPVVLAIFLLLVSPSYMGQLFFGPERGGAYIPATRIPCGWPLIAGGLIQMSIGLAVIRRIVDVEV